MNKIKHPQNRFERKLIDEKKRQTKEVRESRVRRKFIKEFIKDAESKDELNSALVGNISG